MQPHSRINCQGWAIVGVSATPAALAANDRIIVRRTPKRSIIAAAKGPIAP